MPVLAFLFTQLSRQDKYEASLQTNHVNTGVKKKPSELFTTTDSCWYVEGKVDSMSTARYKITTEIL